MIELIFIVPTVLAVFISVVALYYALKRTDYNRKSLKIQKQALRIQKKMWKGSQEYWGSWEDRAQDVSRKVLDQLTVKQLKAELKKRKSKQ